MTVHALSFDVENWYDGNLHNHDRVPSDIRVEAETEQALACLAEYGVTATFFVLGTVASGYPALVRRIAAAGHEVGSHAFTHDMVNGRTPEAFLADLRRSRALLQDLTGQPILGFRAPSWSIDRAAMAWAPAIIAEAGFRYDSSVFPMWTPLYGVVDAPRSPWAHQLPDGATLPELPPAVAALGPLRIPFGGGAYFRLLPLWVTTALLRRCGEPVVMYLHPWELNPVRAPLQAGTPWLPRLTYTYGVETTEARLRTLLRTFSFAAISQVFAAEVEGVSTYELSRRSSRA